jgi:hypothetical protein
MSPTNDRPDPRQFVRRSESTATAANVSDVSASASAGTAVRNVQLADLVEEFERWDGLS